MIRLTIFIAALIACLGALPQAHAAATLLPNGQQCFQASSPTSGGLFGPIVSLGTITGGSGYVSNTYTNVPLTGGSGFGAKATITVTSGSVASVTVTNPGSHFAGADVLSAAAANLGGAGSGFSVPVVSVSTTGTGFIGLLGAITGGSGGVAGTYGGVALTGGSGSGATANITVSGGAVTAVTIVNPGVGYQVADTLSAASGSIGGVTGFSVPISSVSLNQSLAGGSVAMYVPNTSTFKQTWANSAQTILNTNPVVLDANGCAIIYGTGSYRQVLQDASGNVVWDQITTDTSAQQNVFWAGNASGTPNAITLTDAGFNGTDGSIINFFPVSTNTGAATISIASTAFTSIPVVKDTTGGPSALVGGELIQSGQSNAVSVLYSAVQNNFHLLNAAIASASGANTPFCGAVGLKITNNFLPSPNVTTSITANQAVMQTAAGLIINRSGINLTNINTTTGTSTSTPNGMDGEAPGTNNWLYIWLIDNGAAPAGLISSASGNGFLPTMPSGYTYKCRLGAMRVDGSGNLLRTLQLGSEAQYVVQASGNLPVITTTFGTYYTAQSVSAFVPATATKINVSLEAGYAANTGASGSFTVSMGVASNSAYGTPGATGRPPCGETLNMTSSFTTPARADDIFCSIILESTNLFTGQSSSVTGTGTVTLSPVLSAVGWKDNINAN